MSSDLNIQNVEVLLTPFTGQFAGLTIDTLKERVFAVENLASASSVYSFNYSGNSLVEIIDNNPDLISYQIAFADGFVYWTLNGGQEMLGRVSVNSSPFSVTTLQVSLRTEDRSASLFYGLVSISDNHRPAAGK